MNQLWDVFTHTVRIILRRVSCQMTEHERIWCHIHYLDNVIFNHLNWKQSQFLRSGRFQSHELIIYQSFSTKVKMKKFAAIMGTLCSVYTTEINLQYDSDFIQDMIFIFVPTVIYMHSVTLTTYPFVSHHKKE